VNHRFLTIDGWKRLDELKNGEYLALPRQVSTGSGRELTDAQLGLLGHLIGDGCTLPRHAIQYTTNELEIGEIVADLAKEVFGDEISPRIKKERQWYQVYLTSTRHHTHGTRSAIAEWFEELGIWGLRSHEKFVPHEVFQHSPDKIAVFLRHLWSTDGCIRMRRGRKPYPAIYYATSSPRLAIDVQSLLLSLGINARKKSVSQGSKGRDQYHVIVSGRKDITRFIEIVGAVGKYKTDSKEEIAIYLQSSRANTNRDVIPMQVWSRFVKPAMVETGLTHRELYRQLEMSYCGMTIFGQNMSRDRAARVAGVVSSPDLQNLADSDVYWDKIVSIENAGNDEVYDLTVPGPQNFVANNIIAHNSIEQDADMVLFLYRPEVYEGQDSENAGTAELIIGKQRNGPTGTVKLAFLKEYTRFENLSPIPDDEF
jgi:replicative DNA helicase